MTSNGRGRLHARWLGRVEYTDADALQRALHEHSTEDHLLLLEHPPVYTMGSAAKPEHVLVDPSSVGARLVRADRGGDVTYHGPGQLVGYPVMSLSELRSGMRDVVAYVRRIEAVVIATLADFGISAGRHDGFTGVWVDDTKVAAIGVRVARGRTRHGFALNVDPDLSMFEHIVPCGIRDKAVGSMQSILGRPLDMADVVESVTANFAREFGHSEVERADVVFRIAPSDLAAFSREPQSESVASDDVSVPASTAAPVRMLGRLAEANVVVGPKQPRPEWMKVRARLDGDFVEMKQRMRRLDLHTVCEEAGCPNIFECWSDRTATFMILGSRCTRACGFCLVDTRKPLPVDLDEPVRVAAAVVELGLAHAVITCVARDDLADGGAAMFAATIAAVRAASPETTIEVLISDCKGDPDALAAIFAARPDVLNHNLETVARLQRAARPSAGYARSLGVLAQAKQAGLVTKSGLIAGMGETDEEMRAAVFDLRSIGVDLLTVGQYLQPTDRHLPVARWWTPDDFEQLGAYARSLGFRHVESGPLVRSSYHARAGADAALPVVAFD